MGMELSLCLLYTPRASGAVFPAYKQIHKNYLPDNSLFYI